MIFCDRHLLGIEQLKQVEILEILDCSEKYVNLNRETKKNSNILSGLTQINMFFENSTRTQASFELAGKRLGADVMNMKMEGVILLGKADSAIGIGGGVDGRLQRQLLKSIPQGFAQKCLGRHDAGIGAPGKFLFSDGFPGGFNQTVGVTIKIVNNYESVLH